MDREADIRMRKQIPWVPFACVTSFDLKEGHRTNACVAMVAMVNRPQFCTLRTKAAALEVRRAL